MNKTDNSLMWLLILFAGIAVGVATPQSWYAGRTAISAHIAQMSLTR